MWPNPQCPADLFTFTEEILNGKLHFFAALSTAFNIKKCNDYLNNMNKMYFIALAPDNENFYFTSVNSTHFWITATPKIWIFD